MVDVFVWLIALALAILTAGFLGIQLIFRRRMASAVVLSTLALAALYLLIGADSLRLPQTPADSEWALPLNTGMLAIALAAVAVQVWVGWRLLAQSGSWKQIGTAALLVCQIGIAGWTGWRFNQALLGSAAEPLLGGIEMDELAEEALLTDKHRLVPLYRSRVVGDIETYVDFDIGHNTGRCIERASLDPQSNCHGWVFTGGHYLLKGNGVAMILEDNGYAVVAPPLTGDVIVYRDWQQQIVHTGLVRAVFEDGKVLVESKWGVAGRYLHLAEDQHYSQTFAFYRSPRSADQSSGDSRHLVQAVKILPGNHLQRPEEALVGRLQPLVPQPLDSFGHPLPVGESYPMGAE